MLSPPAQPDEHKTMLREQVAIDSSLDKRLIEEVKTLHPKDRRKKAIKTKQFEEINIHFGEVLNEDDVTASCGQFINHNLVLNMSLLSMLAR